MIFFENRNIIDIKVIICSNKQTNKQINKLDLINTNQNMILCCFVIIPNQGT
jgi:hypothetical protein